MYKFGRSLCAFYCGFFIRLKVSGKENIPLKGGVVIASNHLSYLDPIVLGMACPRELNFMAKAELFRNQIFGGLIKSVGAFPVKRNSADMQALKEAIRRVKSGKALVLFPEGGRGDGKMLQDAEAGVGFIAVKAGAPVIPAFINGTEKALPKGRKLMRTAEVTVVFGKQVLLDKNLPYEDNARKIMQDIGKLRH